LQTGAGAVLNVMQPREGQSIAIYGVGGVGLAGLMAAKIAGCDPIIAIDRLPDRLALARELGATHALESRGAETLAEIRKLTGGGTHFALETSAVPQIFRLAVDALRGLGTCILVGSARAGTEVTFEMPWLQGGRTVRGVIQGASRPRDFIPRLRGRHRRHDDQTRPLDAALIAFLFGLVFPNSSWPDLFRPPTSLPEADM